MTEQGSRPRGGPPRLAGLTLPERTIARLAPAGVRPEAFARMPEATRIATIKAVATPPASCGPEIPVSPARGAFRLFTERENVPGSDQRVRIRNYRGHGEASHRHALVEADIFDVMEAQALKAHLRHGGERADFAAPFTPGQVAMARRYRALVEHHSAGGVKCSGLEPSTGGGHGGGFSEAFEEEGAEIRRIVRAIGNGVAIAVRRIRPSARGGASRGAITDRRLADLVCLHGRSLAQVLVAHGWAVNGRHSEALRRALAAALDRVQGYR